MKLSDVVNRINGNVDRFTTDLEYYVGGEHFDSNELAVTRKGMLKENLNVLGFKFHFAFQKRDVLFMARNPHLRKAGMVMFDGLCSDATYILRSKDENVLLQEYLALQLQSDHFWNYCESHKVGSVNFANNWTSIANYEFDLPSIEEQKVLADKLWAAYRVKEAYRQLLSTTDDMLKAKFQEMFGDIDFPKKKISDLLADNFSGEWGEDDVDNLGTLVIKTNNFNNDGSIDFTQLITRNIDAKRVERKRLKSGDILLERSGGTKDNPVGRVVYFDKEGTFVTNNFVQTLRTSEIVNSKYLFYSLYIFYNTQKMEIRRLGHQTSGIQNLDFHKFVDREVKLPPVELQQQFVDIATQAEATKASLRASIEAIDRVIRSLINQ
jgi:restriction endonuclease S subunit